MMTYVWVALGAAILGLVMLGKTEPSGKHKGKPKSDEKPKGFFAALEREHNYGMMIAFVVLPFLFSLALGVNPFGLWDSPYRVTYLTIGLAAFVITGILRFKGELGREILKILFVLLILVASSRMIVGIAGWSDEVAEFMDHEFSLSIPAPALAGSNDVEEFDPMKVNVPRVWQDIGTPPNFGYRYHLMKGWNRTFIFKAPGEDDFSIQPKDTDVILRFEGYDASHAERVYELHVERMTDGKGVWVPTEFNGRLTLYSPGSSSEVLVYKKRGAFVHEADRWFLGHRAPARPDFYDQPGANWQVILRNPEVTFELPDVRYEAEDDLTLTVSGPLIWWNGTRDILLSPALRQPIHVRLGASGYLRFQAVGEHDVFIQISRKS